MKQYCKYCTYCFEADDYRCSNHPKGEEPHWSEKDISRENKCPNYHESDMGSVITGKRYKPRVKRTQTTVDSEEFMQLSLLPEAIKG